MQTRILCLVFCLLLSVGLPAQATNSPRFTYAQGAVVRGDSTKKELALVFTADEYGEGLPMITAALKRQKVKAGFFFTGRFYRNSAFHKYIKALNAEGHYLGPHSDEHLLYCDWAKRDSLLVTKDSFETDVKANLKAMKDLALPLYKPHCFIPPFEWWNDSVAAWTKENGLLLFSFTPGLRTATDYTWPEMGNSYKSSDWILRHLKERMNASPAALNGAVILIHAGTDARRRDKFYSRLNELIAVLSRAGYRFVRIDQLLLK